jgi:hypothetical protein
VDKKLSGIIGRNADIYIDGSLAGAAKGVTVGISGDLIKDYVIGGQDPNVLALGNRSYPISIDTLYVDKTYAAIVLAGAAITIEVHPAGSGGGQEKYVLNNVILNNWEKMIPQDGVVLETISGEGKTITLPT